MDANEQLRETSELLCSALLLCVTMILALPCAAVPLFLLRLRPHGMELSILIKKFLMNRAGDCPQREREQDLFDSVQEIYNFAIKQDVL